MGAYTRPALEVVLRDELGLAWLLPDDVPGDPRLTKRTVVFGYTDGWDVPQLIGLGRRLLVEERTTSSDLRALVDAYDQRGGVASPAKNLIFASTGAKPDIVLRDAVSNDIEIVRGGETCLVFEEPIPADGLSYQRLVDWWRRGQASERDGHDAAGPSDVEVGRALHGRLLASLGDNPAERLVLNVYARRYGTLGFQIPALIPQVYLHYDPYSFRQRGGPGPLERQRMDFLLLFSERQRVVIEVDGKQHYADEAGAASPAAYARMVAEDRRLRLTGYEVYRFGGLELTTPGAEERVASFFDELQQRMNW